MTFRDQLQRIGACAEAKEWVGDKTIEQAWETCEDSQWMLWILSRTDLNLTDPACDMAERVLHLVPEESQLACIWAVSAAKRRANFDELNAASMAVNDAAKSAAKSAAANWAASVYACDAAYAAACYVVSYSSARAATHASARAADDASRAAYYAACAVASDTANIAYYATMQEKKKQCDILRKYFSIDQVREAFNKLVS